MHAFQAAFQASFDARVERLDDVEQDELRAVRLSAWREVISEVLRSGRHVLQVFRFFDTDGDGAVAATQACHMFALVPLVVIASFTSDRC